MAEGDLAQAPTVLDRIKADLEASGLTPADMRIRELGAAERTTTGTPAQVSGYTIPYWDIRGKALTFYRVRLFDYEPKYRQIANEPNHIYFPPGFWDALRHSRAILITEGEKKAASAVKRGIACCAVSGVDSWRNRLLIIPKGTELVTAKDGRLMAKMKSGGEVDEKTGTHATGLDELVSYALHRDLPLVICYDADTNNSGAGSYKRPVAEACARLGFELRSMGIPLRNIRHMILQGYPGCPEKLGLDDFLTDEKLGVAAFDRQIDTCLKSKKAFPIHPNIANYVAKRLQRGKMSRTDMATLAFGILTDLDYHGSRLRNPDNDNLYYFDDVSKSLSKVDFDAQGAFSKMPFGIHMYKKYGLTPADNRLLIQMGAQYPAEDPITVVRPEHIMTVRGDVLYFQIAPGRMVRCHRNDISIVDNGTDGVLFEGGAMEELSEATLVAEIKKAQAIEKLPNIWLTVLQEARIAATNKDQHRMLLSLLYHISPWFYKWNGTQLPVEMMIGEAGSGKSSLYSLRMRILTGVPILRNMPASLRDWTASVAATGAMHVIDNVHFNDNKSRQELSDELCRVVTADNPMIEARKLYSDNDLIYTPVKCVFAMTGIKQPFTNVDIVQRSIITQLDKGSDEVEYDTDWVPRQLERFGGREGWLAHQLVFQQRLFSRLATKWSNGYKAKYRLINVEQLLCHVAEMFDMPTDWIANYLAVDTVKGAISGDWALEGLKTFCDDWASHSINNKFGAKEIVEWATGEEDFQDCKILQSSRSLGKYIQTNKNLLSTVCGLQEYGTLMNRTMYRVLPRVDGDQ